QPVISYFYRVSKYVFVIFLSPTAFFRPFSDISEPENTNICKLNQLSKIFDMTSNLQITN
ncbi:hypothetical protein L9F63_022416, partial [Diploptera punctata]